jgi:hypothetical protein
MDLTAFFNQIIVIFILVIINGFFAMSEEKIKQLFKQGARTGVFHPSEINLVERVLKLDDRSVGHLMTLPKDIIWFEENEYLHQE